MESIARTLHLVVGIVTVLLFLVSGVYMKMVFPDIYKTNESVRFLFRANHIYILFSGLINVCFGMYVTAHELPRLKRMQQIGSWLVAIAPLVFITAFLVEPVQASPSRPITAIAVFSTTIGVGLHLLASIKKQKS